MNFEGVTKTGTGVLMITGPGVTDLQRWMCSPARWSSGRASVVATVGTSLNTLMAGGRRSMCKVRMAAETATTP